MIDNYDIFICERRYIMDYKTSIEFIDWLLWDKEMNEKEWAELSEEAKEAVFNEFKENRRKRK